MPRSAARVSGQGGPRAPNISCKLIPQAAKWAALHVLWSHGLTSMLSHCACWETDSARTQRCGVRSRRTRRGRGRANAGRDACQVRTSRAVLLLPMDPAEAVATHAVQQTRSTAGERAPQLPEERRAVTPATILAVRGAPLSTCSAAASTIPSGSLSSWRARCRLADASDRAALVTGIDRSSAPRVERRTGEPDLA